MLSSNSIIALSNMRVDLKSKGKWDCVFWCTGGAVIKVALIYQGYDIS